MRFLVLNINSYFVYILQAFYLIKEYMTDFYEVLLIGDYILTVIVGYVVVIVSCVITQQP